jgi:hypothetical protein
MANKQCVSDVIKKATAAGCLHSVVVIGTDKEGKLQLFLDDAEREHLIVILERAKSMLVRSLD